MRNCKNVQIDEIFVHILDNRAPELVTSDFPLQLGSSAALQRYFTGHIGESLRDPGARAARFQNINPSQASGVCHAVLAGSMSLADGSKALARLLYEIIEKDQRISPADLAVCFYHGHDDPAETCLAVLKIDPSEVFQHLVSHEDGKTRVDFTLSTSFFTREKLQKCVFVRPLEPRHADYDMLLLDRQTGAAGAEIAVTEMPVARFFAERFLDAVEAFDATRRTAVFYRAAMDAANSVRHLIAPVLSQDIDQRLGAAVSGQRINVDAWIKSLPVDETIRDQFRQAISARITDVDFETDREIGGKLAARITYAGDHGLRLSVPSEFYDQLIREVGVIQTPEGERTRIVIHTKTWTKVSR